MTILNNGRVVLAGAGPGDPDLISVKALRYLQTADVILTDRLVSPVLIAGNARPDATVIYVGKQCSKGIHTPQEDINKLMSDFALQGLLVLRLKGGDASLFSNVLDELQVLKEHRIPYEIVPGISAAFGAAAYTGIPLTARGYARGVRFLTLFELQSVTPVQWTDWAATEDTLVFYMSGLKLDQLIKQFTAHGVDPEKSIAIVQEATTPNQKTTILNFGQLNDGKLPEFEFVPTITLVGRVVNLHQHYRWLQEKPPAGSYFDNHKNTYQNAI
jgi:uroporphyrin-III C-methyltransferase